MGIFSHAFENDEKSKRIIRNRQTEIKLYVYLWKSKSIAK